LNIAQGIFPFQPIADDSKFLITSLGGLPLVMETYRPSVLPQSVENHLPILHRPGRYEEADNVESLANNGLASCFPNLS